MRAARIFINFVFVIGCIFTFSNAAVGKTPVEAFARLPVFGDAALSPDGKYFALKTNIDGKYYFQIFEIKGKDINRTFAARTDDLEVRWIEWVTDTRVLISLGKAYRRYGTPTYETRLFAVNFDGSKQTDMIKQDRGEIQVQIQDRVIDLLPDDPEHIIMVYNTKDARKPKPHRVNIFSGKGHPIEGGEKNISGWVTDRQGRVRVGWGRKDSTWRYIIRDVDTNKWRTLKTANVNSSVDFSVHGFGKDPNILYVSSNHAGGPSALYEYDVRNNTYVRKVFGHPQVDVHSIWWNEQSWRPRRVGYILDGVKHHWLDPVAQSEFNNLYKSLPGLGFSVVDTSKDDQVWLIHASNVDKPGGYYVFNRRIRNVSYIGDSYPELKYVKLSKTISFDYKARDGLTIPAFLTLPPAYTSVSAAKNLPLVVMPHGGPASRDYLGFDPFAQMLANRGYAVLQMNFRGSWGYGANFETAGHGEWGGKMQDDVTDGANYVIGQGIADRNRICIFGGSYGGYAALMGAVKTPNLYKCAVGLNGVYDLRKLMSDDFWYVGRGRSGYWQAVIGKYSDKAFLQSISPDSRAGEIQIPILLAAADDDRTVRSSQTKDMANALKRNGKSVEFLEFESGGHGLITTDSRVPFMKALDAFLAKHLK